ncbi:GNAT family N-acetyltransferase [Luteimonas sp. SJ-92]|uniref:GNAT family N-acetyltransferase n=1 Tax=Luteimonas salinisoli TaxID=2752307 RepID=A0A853JE49_9GAMM|nr:GNAT family N-acetyltransferase [Luteimonas salinisoli]
MGTLKIRIASVSDLSTIQIIGRETYREHFPSIWSDDYLQEFLRQDFSKQSLQHSLSSPSHTWLIAQDTSDSVVGYAKLNWDRPEPIFNRVGTELQKIYFRSCTTGQGYGGALLEFIVDMAEKRSDMLWLDVLKSNLGAQRFYASRGFHAMGEIPFNTDISEIGMVVMARPLTVDKSFKPNPLRGSP